MIGMTKTQLKKRKSALLAKAVRTSMAGAPIFNHGYNHCRMDIVEIIRELNTLISRL